MSELLRPRCPKVRASQSIADGREKFRPVERLLEQTVLTWDIKRRPMQQVGTTGDQDDRQLGPCGLDCSCWVDAVDDAHAGVREQRCNVPETTTLQQRRSG